MWIQLLQKKGTPAPTQCLAHVSCGQMAGWMKTPLGTEVDLDPGHIALNGIPAPAKGAQQPPTSFRSMSVVATVAHLNCWALVQTVAQKCRRGRRSIAPLQRVQNAAVRLNCWSHNCFSSIMSSTGYRWSITSSSKLRCIWIKSTLNDVSRTLLTSSPFAGRTVSDDLCAQCRLVQTSFNEHGLISDDVRFAVWGPDVWNSLPPSLRTVTSYSAFCRALKI